MNLRQLEVFNAVVQAGSVTGAAHQLNVSQPAIGGTEAFLAVREKITDAVHALVRDFRGSIAAEHGIGQMKRALLPQVRSPAELGLMRTLKAALDPKGILNPGKILRN